MRSPLRIKKLRGRDRTGNGWYGAKRGHREHQGVDYVGTPGENVYACISGKIRIGKPYSDSRRRKFKLIEIKSGKESEGTFMKVKQMYVEPIVSNGQWVSEGQIIGTLQDIGDFYAGGMPNHCHVGVWKNGLLTDPEPLIR